MAQLNIKERQAGDVAILDLDGEVRIGDSATALRGAIRSLVAGGNQKILLNLAGVKYIDSSGIGELIANYTTVGRGGGQLKLRSEEHTSELQSLAYLVCRLLLEKKKKQYKSRKIY